MSKKHNHNGTDDMNARELVLDCATPAVPGESRKAMLVRASRNTGLSYARMVAFFYAKGNPPPEAKEKLSREAQRIKTGWADMQLDRRLSELGARREQLQKELQELDRKMSATIGNLDHGRRASDSRLWSEDETG